MSNIQNQKSGLAKLMATENLTVQHAKVQTASFDPKNRILTIPIWEKISPEMYDLLTGHEVGHAIDTPADGWHGAVHKRGANYKGFLNVVEDARIEKRQKRRYPGLRRSFVIGFGELMKRDFFGIGERDMDYLPFIDRLNLYTKSGYTLPITFNQKEQSFVDRVQLLETWEDVLKLTEEIWDYSKEEQSQINMPEHNFSNDGSGDEEGDSEAGSGEGDSETDAKGNQKSKARGDGDGEDEKESESSSGNKTDDEQDELGNGDSINRFKESQSSNEHQEPRCETDENYRRNETSLINKKSLDYVYVNLPQPNLNKIVTPAKRVQEVLTKEFSDQTSSYDKIANGLYNEFRRKNERFISLLAKEFEMRKAADKFSKAKTSDTGDIDVGRIFKYQFDDAIFKKVMRVPKGKSHGLVLLLDKSGSMTENLASSYEQILILASFCRKVNIPFAAYGFGNSTGVRDIDFPNEKETSNFSNGCFTENFGELLPANVYLREMLNSRMSKSEFSKAVKNILCLMDAWSYRHRRMYIDDSTLYRPVSECLSNTPLSEALIACQPLINEFRKNNNLDIVNLCVVHDGDADSVNKFYTKSGNINYFSPRTSNVYLVDKKTKIQTLVPPTDDGVRTALCSWLSKTTGVKIIGFYLTPNHAIKSALRNRFYHAEVNDIRDDASKRYELSDVITKYQKILKKEKFLESKNPGYESFFFIPGGNDLSVDDEEFEAPSKITASSLTKAFSKYTKNRQVNRVLVSRFIGMIAV